MLKKLLKITTFFILFCLGLIIIYLSAAFILSRIAVNSKVVPKDEITVFILTNGVHTDIVLPIKSDNIDWSQSIAFNNTNSKDSLMNFIAFGWGDKGFYLETPTWTDLKFSVAFNAAFGLGKSAMHTTFYKQMNESEHCKRISLSSSEYQLLVEYITSSFQKSASGEVLIINSNANYGANDAFYEGIGKYSLFHTCNTWANNGLKACNQKACLWTPADKGIFYHYND